MHDLDWVERVRRTCIRAVGLTGTVSDAQYVGTLDADPEAFERVLHDHGIRRNALAYFKRDPSDGDWSVGSWVYLHGNYWSDLQDHLTIFPDGELYVHREYNWRTHPIKHVREAHFSYPIAEWRQTLNDWGVGYSATDSDE